MEPGKRCLHSELSLALDARVSEPVPDSQMKSKNTYRLGEKCLHDVDLQSSKENVSFGQHTASVRGREAPTWNALMAIIKRLSPMLKERMRQFVVETVDLFLVSLVLKYFCVR